MEADDDTNYIPSPNGGNLNKEDSFSFNKSNKTKATCDTGKEYNIEGNNNYFTNTGNNNMNNLNKEMCENNKNDLIYFIQKETELIDNYIKHTYASHHSQNLSLSPENTINTNTKFPPTASQTQFQVPKTTNDISKNLLSLEENIKEFIPVTPLAKVWCLNNRVKKRKKGAKIEKKSIDESEDKKEKDWENDVREDKGRSNGDLSLKELLEKDVILDDNIETHNKCMSIDEKIEDFNENNMSEIFKEKSESFNFGDIKLDD